MARLIIHCASLRITKALTAFMLLANANVDSSQGISVLAAAASSRSAEDSTTGANLKWITY